MRKKLGILIFTLAMVIGLSGADAVFGLSQVAVNSGGSGIAVNQPGSSVSVGSGVAVSQPGNIALNLPLNIPVVKGLLALFVPSIGKTIYLTPSQLTTFSQTPVNQPNVAVSQPANVAVSPSGSSVAINQPGGGIAINQPGRNGVSFSSSSGGNQVAINQG